MAPSSSSPAVTPPANHPLWVTVRFTTSIPDLLLDISAANKTTIVALKQLIRKKLDPLTAVHRLRLIHGGKLLQDDDILSSVVKVPQAPPRAPDPSGKGKGKEIEDLPSRVYINCSIGDILSPEELSDEAARAARLPTEKKKESASGGGRNAGPGISTLPTPRGFDRLLSGGFTPAEVNQLRLQFLSIQSNIHTPDTMPSPTTLRRMEDAWIDDNAGDAGGTGEVFDLGGDGMGSGAVDDLLWGNIMGFLWPLGCVGWVLREGDVWSGRRNMAVFTGFLLSLTFGILRVMS
ncbi:DUF2407 C-terminal domain-containing protein [Xylogone sp. PMI_703]|nr:DUF2407 C-terminal domain-containing protein [Xylogone sp. PMI_703]